MDHKLTPELQELSEHVISLAKKEGLTFFPIEFLLVDSQELNAIAAYGGFPVKFTHWRFGMEFNRINQEYINGISKIYELVINTNPVYAYLMRVNPLVDQKLVMAHVCGHADFFYNNIWFQVTNKNMLDQMANNASRIKRIVESVSETEVETFIDTCLSIDNLIDIYSPYIKRTYQTKKEEGYDSDIPPTPRLPAKDYMDGYINTPEFLNEQKKKIEDELKAKKEFPEHPERDILGFLAKHAPLSRWQRDILSIVREEAYYFVPQMMTKVMNEGFAVWVHSKLMTEKLVTDSEIIDYCDHHAGVLASGNGFNPYKIGFELYKDIERRWNTGRHGLAYERCEDEEQKRIWDTKENKGKEKIFQVRKTYNDVTFIDEFLTPEFCAEHNLFVYEHLEDSNSYQEATREFHQIKKQLLAQLANGGHPVIELINANYDNRSEMFLRHVYDGKELDLKQGEDTIEALYRLWTRPIHLQTVMPGDKSVIWHYDGDTHWITNLDDEESTEPLEKLG